MKCEFCDEEIKYELTRLKIGSESYIFCDNNCLDHFVDENMTVEVIEDDQCEEE